MYVVHSICSAITFNTAVPDNVIAISKPLRLLCLFTLYSLWTLFRCLEQIRDESVYTATQTCLRKKAQNIFYLIRRQSLSDDLFK